MLTWSWSQARNGWIAALVLVVLFAVACGWLGPRGPVTATEALATMAAALLVGVAAGTLSGDRWSVLVAPLVFVAAFEAARLGAVGPTVDLVQPGSLYGVIAFVVGRAVHGALALLPLALGAGYGVALARSMGHLGAPAMGAVGWTASGIATVGLLVLAVLVARPASTHPILGADGLPLAGSVAELTTVTIGGRPQALMIRGRSVGSPVLLYLAGGPGGTDLGALRRDVGLEQRFVVVAWDQRGAGRSYTALEPVADLTLDRLVADAIEVTEHLRARFGVEKVYLAGQSWGSMLAVLAAQRRPDLYHAVVGVGQMVSLSDTDRMFWEDALAWAVATGRERLAQRLLDNGPPPYPPGKMLDYEPVVAHEHDWNRYPGLDLGHEMPGALFVPEYAFMDRVNAFRGFLDTAGVLYPRLQELDLRHDVPALGVPYYLVLGEHEARGRVGPAQVWFDGLSAPLKERVVLEGSGHRANFDRPDAFAGLMTGVLGATAAGSGGPP